MSSQKHARPAFHPYQTDTKAEAQTLSKVTTQGLQSTLWSEANKALLFSPHHLGNKWPSGVTFPRIQSKGCLHLNSESQEKRSVTLLSQIDFPARAGNTASVSLFVKTSQSHFLPLRVLKGMTEREMGKHLEKNEASAFFRYLCSAFLVAWCSVP